NREDWNKLDELLGKEGFDGGYYRLVDCLKDIAVYLISDLSVDDKTINVLKNEANDLNTIHKSVGFLQLLMTIKK
ncbi:unnamed protein product, partial [marine sediment metagenome]